MLKKKIIIAGTAGSAKASALVQPFTKNNSMNGGMTTEGMGDRRQGGGSERAQSTESGGFVARWFGSSRAVSPPTADDVASTFFTFKDGGSDAREHVHAVAAAGGAHARNRSAAARGDRGGRVGRGHKSSSVAGGKRGGGGGGGSGTVKVAGSWRPGAAAVSPGLVPAENGGG